MDSLIAIFILAAFSLALAVVVINLHNDYNKEKQRNSNLLNENAEISIQLQETKENASFWRRAYTARAKNKDDKEAIEDINLADFIISKEEVYLYGLTKKIK